MEFLSLLSLSYTMILLATALSKPRYSDSILQLPLFFTALETGSYTAYFLATPQGTLRQQATFNQHTTLFRSVRHRSSPTLASIHLHRWSALLRHFWRHRPRSFERAPASLDPVSVSLQSPASPTTYQNRSPLPRWYTRPVRNTRPKAVLRLLQLNRLRPFQRCNPPLSTPSGLTHPTYNSAMIHSIPRKYVSALFLIIHPHLPQYAHPTLFIHDTTSSDQFHLFSDKFLLRKSVMISHPTFAKNSTPYSATPRTHHHHHFAPFHTFTKSSFITSRLSTYMGASQLNTSSL